MTSNLLYNIIVDKFYFIEKRKVKLTIYILTISFCLSTSLEAQTYLGDYTGYSIEGKRIRVNVGSSSVEFIFYKPEILRVYFLPTDSTQFDSSFVIIQDTTENVALSTVETDTSLEISSSSIRIVCSKIPLRISYFNLSGELLLAEPQSGGLATNGEERWVIFGLSPDDHFYGTGERGTCLDKRGQVLYSYNQQVFGYDGPVSTMNLNVPFTASTNGYALYFENTYPGEFDLGFSDSTRFLYGVFGGELSYFLIVAQSIKEQLDRYTWLTGRQPLPPRWSLGYIQSKYGYRNEWEAREFVQTVREKGIPCDAIVLDLYWFVHMGDISWNHAAWPDPFQMMSDFLNQGIKTIVITEPYIVEHSSNFWPAFAYGYFAKDSLGIPYLIEDWWSCNCDAGLLDLTNPSAQNWWWDKHPAFFGDELAGIWTDLGEPESHPEDMYHYLGRADKVHNIFNLLWAKTLFEGFNQFRPNQRLFNLTRSGYAGIQRYGVAPWSGDVGTSFGALAVQIPMMLNMGMSGLAYHNSDIGGFCCGYTSPELYVRWMQYGTFCPVTRAHGPDYQPQEPWGYSEETEEICKRYIQLRYRLLPYIYTFAFKNYQSGLPIAIPLFFEYPDDNSLSNESSSYLWGDAILVSPVVEEGQGSKSLHLPEGKWIYFWADEVFCGGQAITVDTPLDIMPLFVKAGSIIPMQPIMDYTDQSSLDTLMLEIYPSPEIEASFTLYEDDGKTLDYRSGGFSQTQFNQSISCSRGDTSLSVDIGAAEGVYDGKPEDRVYLCGIHCIADKPTAVWKNGEMIPERPSYEVLRQEGDGFFYDSLARCLYIHIPGFTDSTYALCIDDISIYGILSPSLNILSMEQIYPNPFSSTTTICYSVTHSARVSIKVYDILGREVATIVDEVEETGRYEAEFDLKNYRLEDLSSGVYFVRLVAGDKSVSKRIVCLRH